MQFLWYSCREYKHLSYMCTVQLEGRAFHKFKDSVHAVALTDLFLKYVWIVCSNNTCWLCLRN